MDTKSVEEVTNGAAMAAVLGAAIGSFTLGLIVLFKATGLLSIPALYQPAGGVSGRTTLAVVIWLIVWGILHYRWKDQHISYQRTLLLSLILIGGSIVFTFPPLWSLF
mgnify:CR=1 FL=1